MKKILTSLSLFAFATTLVLTFQNCAPETEMGSTDLPSSDDPASIAAFSTTLHPVLITNCGSCHGSSQGPRFAVSSDSDAHATIVMQHLVSFDDPSGSTLTSKVRSGHQGISLSVATQIESAVADWSASL